jgi:DNA-binding Xre family transcriptional regulator
MARLRIKEAAHERKMSQKDLAEKSQVTLQLLNRYWNNHMQRVELDQLEKIARALGLRSGDLLVDEGPMAKYYLVVANRNETRAEKLRDCQSDHLEVAEQEALAEFKTQRTQGKDDIIVRVVDAETGTVEFAIHKDNIDNLLKQ